MSRLARLLVVVLLCSLPLFAHAATLLSVTATAGPGGRVTPTSIGGIFSGQKVFSPIRFTFTPNTAFRVVSITGVPAGATVSSALPAATNASVVVTLPVNFIFTTNIALVGSFSGPPVANAGPPQTVLPNTQVTLDGSASTGTITTYTWVQTAGPATVTLAPSGSKATFTSTVLGTYTFKLTVTGGSFATTTVFVTNDPAAAARSQCQNCHQGNGVGTATNVFGNWSTSLHRANFVMCANCHVGANTGGHPGSITSNTVNAHTFNFVATGANFCITCHDPNIPADFAASVHVAPAGGASCSFCHASVHNPDITCVNCHTPGNPYGLPWPPTGLSFHNDFTGSDCVNCHKVHNPEPATFTSYPHFSTYSTAQYVTTNISCNNCHRSAVDNSFNIYSANRDWAKSGHGNPVSPAFIGRGPYTEANLEAADYKFLGTPLPAKPANTVKQDCVRCHTTTGYINYVTPTDLLNDPDRLTSFSDIHAWGTPGDRTREMVACPACHTPTPFSADFSRRTVGLIDSQNGQNSTFTNVVQAWYNYSSATTKIIRSKLYTDALSFGSELGQSNICIVCHSGTAAGDLIKQSASSTSCGSAAQINQNPSIVCRLGGIGAAGLTAGLTHTFWATADFIDPHGMAAANVMYPDNLRAGYEYRTGASIAPTHSDIGSGETENTSVQGPCVACHMTAPKKHVFSPVSSASNGVISAVTSPLCASCHNESGSAFAINSAADVELRRAGYQAALSVIPAQLAARGVFFNAALPPYFFTTANTALQGPATRVTNWNALAPGGQGAHLMGAAFNLRLLQTDAGWVHGPVTSKRLIFDTIDYLNDGVVSTITVSTATAINNAVGATIDTMLGSGSDAAGKARGYLIPRP